MIDKQKELNSLAIEFLNNLKKENSDKALLIGLMVALEEAYDLGRKEGYNEGRHDGEHLYDDFPIFEPFPEI